MLGSERGLRCSLRHRHAALRALVGFFCVRLGLVWHVLVSALSDGAVLMLAENCFHKVVWLRPALAPGRRVWVSV